MTTWQMPTVNGVTRRGALIGALAGAGTLALAGCGTGGGAGSGGGSGADTILNVAGQSDNLTRVFNPFLANTAQGLTYVSQGQGGFIYEPLVQVNTVDIGNDLPWLAHCVRGRRSRQPANLLSRTVAASSLQIETFDGCIKLIPLSLCHCSPYALLTVVIGYSK